jgi:precorrin-6B methylase 2
MRSVATVAVVLACGAVCARAQDVPFLETPEPVVEAMLDLAGVGAGDVLYDLGSGDGRIVIAAARRGARGVGIESNPELVVLAERNAQAAGVAERVWFQHADLFQADLSPATAVAVYLNPRTLRRLGPRLAAQLAPGTPIVSHKYEIEGWVPEQRAKAAGRTLFLYRVPAP